VRFRSLSVAVGASLVIAGVASAQTTALTVGARVAPQCRINVDAAPDATQAPGVRVTCGRAGLRVLRVTTDRGDGLEPVTTFAGNQLRAGGEVRFMVVEPLATVASLLPVFAMPAQPDHKPITVTLDF
jgi:hypothetical protein